jgi:hypothetical protein
MTPGPIHPDEYDGEHLNTDEKIEAKGYAAGLDVWGQVDKAYGNYLGDGTLANAQLWSLREAIRAEALAEFRDKLGALAAIEDYIAESGENAARNIRDLLAGTGADGNDPRVQARAWGLEWTP